MKYAVGPFEPRYVHILNTYMKELELGTQQNVSLLSHYARVRSKSSWLQKDNNKNCVK